MSDLNDYATECADANDRWWRDPATGESVERNMGEMLMLCVSELSEAMEGHRKNLPDNHLPLWPMFEVELADVLIRIFDIAGHYAIDLEGVYREKMEYNAQRADHTNEARLQPHGKKY